VRVQDGFVNDEPISMTQPFAAGALCSTARDLLTWERALHGGRVVSSASYGQMVSPFVLNDGSLTEYGFGLAISELDAYRVVNHSGGINGFSSHLSYFPDADLTIVALSNTEGASLWNVARDIARTALGTMPAEPEDRTLPPEQRERYVGNYDAANANIRVFTENDHLWAQITGQAPFRLLYQGGQRFVAEFDHSIELRFVARGRHVVEFSLVQGNRVRRALRVPF
jgi:CubicO group peptidase (beta-lactamase class C family)